MEVADLAVVDLNTQFEGDPADHLFPPVSQNLQPLFVHIDAAPLRHGGDADEHRDAVEDLGQLHLRLAQPLFRAFSLGDVLANHKHVDSTLQTGHYLGYFLHPYQDPVLTDLAELPSMHLTGIIQTPLQLLHHGGAVVLVKKCQHLHPLQFVQRIAQLGCSKRVGRKYGPPGIQREDHGGIVAKQGPVARLAETQHLFRPLSLRNVMGNR